MPVQDWGDVGKKETEVRGDTVHYVVMNYSTGYCLVMSSV